jgi:hypothetical protein
MPAAVAFEQARHYAEVAIKIDPQFPNAYVLLRDIHNMYDWDWAGADRKSVTGTSLGSQPVTRRKAVPHCGNADLYRRCARSE